MQSIPERYEYLEHTADARFRAYGNNLEETFENAAVAMFNIMLDLKDIKCKKEYPVEVVANDPEELLVEWLLELLFLFEVEYIAFSGFNIKRISIEEEQCSLSAQACGELLDLKRHTVRTEIKAVTYNDLLLEISPTECIAEVTVDL